GRRPAPPRPGQPERHVREPPAHRGGGGARGRRRVAGGEVPPGVHLSMTSGPAEDALRQEAATSPAGDERTLTIGAVCRLPQPELPTIAFSKLRFREARRPPARRRPRGGYRLYSPLDVERLRTILRLQRDEFLPLRVIRQELESSTTGAFSVANQARQLK